MWLKGRGVFLNNSSMDDLFFESHELAARDRKEKTENYLRDNNWLSALFRNSLNDSISVFVFFF